MQPPAMYTARLEDKIILTPKHVQYMFEFTQPHEMNFQAGQYVSLKVAERGDRRSYSICSEPSVKHGIELMVDHTPNGIGCQYLANLQFGDTVSLLGPMGHFVVPADTQETGFYFIATGSGITPFRAMILDLIARKEQRPIVLYWGLRHEEDMFWELEFQELARNYANFTFHIILSQPKPDWPLSRGRVTDLVTALDKQAGAGYYLCGNGKMVQEVLAYLQGIEIPSSHIHHEMFY